MGWWWWGGGCKAAGQGGTPTVEVWAEEAEEEGMGV